MFAGTFGEDIYDINDVQQPIRVWSQDNMKILRRTVVIYLCYILNYLRHILDICKTRLRHIQDMCKTYLRHLSDILARSPWDHLGDILGLPFVGAYLQSLSGNFLLIFSIFFVWVWVGSLNFQYRYRLTAMRFKKTIKLLVDGTLWRLRYDQTTNQAWVTLVIGERKIMQRDLKIYLCCFNKRFKFNCQ